MAQKCVPCCKPLHTRGDSVAVPTGLTENPSREPQAHMSVGRTEDRDATICTEMGPASLSALAPGACCPCPLGLMPAGC